MDLSFYNGKTVLITGHTGFKGAWMCKVLLQHGAQIVGYALESPTSPSLFELLHMDNEITSILGDVRDVQKLMETVKTHQPEIVIHMAAQPLVRESYTDPVYTYETNVMGTVNICEAIRQNNCVKSFVNVTTDKVYQNKEWVWAYRENEVLNGYDPYSNSKSCSELVTSSYSNSFFNDIDIAVSTCRAGNVIGGGDFSKDRIIPDCVRAMEIGKEIIIRNSTSIRPYQHVLEPVCAYLLLAKEQYKDRTLAGNYNIGPDEIDCITTGSLVDLFCKKWGNNARWKLESDSNAPHEAQYLKLDCSKIKTTLKWLPKWNIDTAIDMTITWSKFFLDKGDINLLMDKQIKNYLSIN